jgi:hypothetical protein
MLALLRVLVCAIWLDDVTVQTMVVVVVMGIGRCFRSKQFNKGRVVTHLVWMPVTANMLVQADYLVSGRHY